MTLDQLRKLRAKAKDSVSFDDEYVAKERAYRQACVAYVEDWLDRTAPPARRANAVRCRHRTISRIPGTGHFVARCDACGSSTSVSGSVSDESLREMLCPPQRLAKIPTAHVHPFVADPAPDHACSCGIPYRLLIGRGDP